MSHVSIIIFVASITLITLFTTSSAFAETWSFEPSEKIVIQHGFVINYTDSSETRDELIANVTSDSDTQGIHATLQRYKSTDSFTTTIIKITTGATDQHNHKLNTAIGNKIYVNGTDLESDAVLNNYPSNPFYDPPYQYWQDSFLDFDAVDCTDDDRGGDSDKDGICDDFEDQDEHEGFLIVDYPPNAVNGVGTGANYTWNCGSDCPTIGTRDVLVEVDWMQGHEPFNTSLKNATQALKHSGLDLRIQKDEKTINHMTDTVIPGFWMDPGSESIKNQWFGTKSERGGVDTPFGPNTWTDYGWKQKKQVFHYAQFFHKQANNPTASGSGEIRGNDFSVTLGSFDGSIGSADQQAGTFVHELGHNLGLNHGGTWLDTVNCKPNYLGVMSYTMQFSDLIGNRTLAYSLSQIGNHTAGSISLNESDLDGDDGLGSVLAAYPTEQTIVYGNSNGDLFYNKTGVTSIGWDGSQDISYIVADAEVICPISGGEMLYGNNDTQTFIDEGIFFRGSANWLSGRAGLDDSASITISEGGGIPPLAPNNHLLGMPPPATCGPIANCNNTGFIQLPYNGTMITPFLLEVTQRPILQWMNNDTNDRFVEFQFSSPSSSLSQLSSMNMSERVGELTELSYSQPFEQSGKYTYFDPVSQQEGLIVVGQNWCLSVEEVHKYNLNATEVNLCGNSEMTSDDVKDLRHKKVDIIYREVESIPLVEYDDPNPSVAKAEHLNGLLKIRNHITNDNLYPAMGLLNDLRTNMTDTIKPAASQYHLQLIDDTLLSHGNAIGVHKPELVPKDPLPRPIIVEEFFVPCGPDTEFKDGICISTVKPVSCGFGTELNDDKTACVTTVNPVSCGFGTEFKDGSCISTGESGLGIVLATIFGVVAAVFVYLTYYYKKSEKKVTTPN